MSDDTTPLRFSESQVRVLAAVLDELIPPRSDGRLPGAGALGVARAVEAALQGTPPLLGMIADGLSALAEKGFADRSPAERCVLLDELASGEHAFPPMLILQTYIGYYQHPRVVVALGLEARPPHPQGYAMAPDDPTLLDPVRRRPSLWRTVE